MGRFPLFKRLLVVMFLWPVNVTTGNEIWSQTEGEWKGFKITDRVPSRSLYYESNFLGRATWSETLKNVTAHQLEKATITFPDCDSDRVGKKIAPNMTEIVGKIKQMVVNPNETGCQISAFLSEFRKNTEGLFSRYLSESCSPSWARVTGNNLWGNKSAVFHHGEPDGKSSIAVQKGRHGIWANAFQSNITGKDARYRFNMISGVGPNRTFALVILVDHFVIVDDLPAKALNATEDAGASQGRTGKLFLRFYIPLENGSNGSTDQTSTLETASDNITFAFNLTKCENVFVVEKFFKDVIENGSRIPTTPSPETTPKLSPETSPKPSLEPVPKPEGSGWAGSPWMICLYVLLTLTFLSLGGILLIKWINKSGNGSLCGRFILPFDH